MALSDKNAYMQVIGGLMTKPSLLDEGLGTSLNKDDFDAKLPQILFIAIFNLYKNGARLISIVDIDNYFKDYAPLAQIFEKQNGIQYLQDCEDIAILDNFDYYCERVKKFSALRALSIAGIDITEYYNVKETDPIKEAQQKERFDAISLAELFILVNARIAKIESRFAGSASGSSGSAGDDIVELIESLKKSPEVGLPLQGEMWNTVVRGARLGKFYLRSGATSSGKAITNSTKIPTPDGWKTIGDIRIGDYLFDALGQPTKVIDVFPQGTKEVYRVTFESGDFIDCCEDHLWSYNSKAQKPSEILNRRFFTKTTKELIKILDEDQTAGCSIRIPMPKPVEYTTKSFFVDPYVFGLLLGNGSFREHPSNKVISYSSENEELPNVIAAQMGWHVKRNSLKNYTWYFSYGEMGKNVYVSEVLKEFPELINVYSQDKFIPQKYLMGNIQQRLDLLNGLLDSDGTINDDGTISFFSNSFALIEGVMELSHSLGLKTRYVVDDRKENPNYVVAISGPLEIKSKLFRLNRKRQRLIDWINNGKRKESKPHNSIISIEKTGRYEEMTCFLVDNEEHLFLVGNYIVTHNSRTMFGDACYLAYPWRYSSRNKRWEQVAPIGQKVLIITTELDLDEVRTVLLANLADINEEKILYGAYTEEEEERVMRAASIMTEYKDNLLIEQIDDPNIARIKATVRKHHSLNNIRYLFYDYIFTSPNLLNEFRDVRVREDVALGMLSTALKDLAVELNIFVMSATQLSGEYENARVARTQTMLRSAKSIADKVDVGSIISPVMREDLIALDPIIKELGCENPTIVSDIYKVRRGRYKSARIWSKVDLGTARIIDLFATDQSYNPLSINRIRIHFQEESDWGIVEEEKEVKLTDTETINVKTGEIVKKNRFENLI